MHDTRQGHDTENVAPVFVSDLSGDHAAEGVPDDGERLIPEAVADLGETSSATSTVLSSVAVTAAASAHGRSRNTSRHGRPCNASEGAQPDAMVHPEAVKSDVRTTKTDAPCDHPAGLRAVRRDDRSPTRPLLQHRPLRVTPPPDEVGKICVLERPEQDSVPDEDGRSVALRVGSTGPGHAATPSWAFRQRPNGRRASVRRACGSSHAVAPWTHATEVDKVVC